MKAQLMISADGARKGKTVFTMGLLLALKRAGMTVQPFKCGVNCVDAQLHELSCGVPSVNLDAWMTGPNRMRALYNSYGERADVVVVEGDKGLYDGYNCMKGSSADISRTLQLPVLMVMDARCASYSIAPVIYGFMRYRSSVRIMGVVFNQVASQAQYAYLKQVCRDVGVECLGWLPVISEMSLPSLGQGISHSARSELMSRVEETARQIATNVDLNKLLGLSQGLFPCRYSLPYTSDDIDLSYLQPTRGKRMKIAIANDSAFYSTFRDNTDSLRAAANVSTFSVLHSHTLPEADAYYFPGGCLELYARQIHRNQSLLSDIRDKAESGKKMLAEGGAMALFADTLVGKGGKAEHQMAGVIHARCIADSTLTKGGYRSVIINNKTQMRGYESTPVSCEEVYGRMEKAQVYDVKGVPVRTPFWKYKNLTLTTVSWHWGQTPLLLSR